MEIIEERKTDLLSGVLFDFDETEETKLKTESEFQLVDENDVLAVVLLFKNSFFKGVLKPYEMEICGKKMADWVTSATSMFETKTICADEDSSIVPLIKPLLNEKKNVLVLYSDTPLITTEKIKEIIDYFNFKGLNVLKLNRGWVFNTEYIKNAESVSSVITKDFEGDDFFVVSDYASLEKASSTLKNKILDFHLNNGVFIEDKNSTFIDADVILEPGVKVFASNVIKGETFVGAGTILESGNKIYSSIIGRGCDLRCSFVKNSKISDKMVVGPYEIIDEKESWW